MEIAEIVAKLERELSSTRFRVLVRICTAHFGKPRVRGSHYIFKTPWPGDPRLNLQADGANAKPYQVKQVIGALRRLIEIDSGDSHSKQL